jgi:hypothetical protein
MLEKNKKYKFRVTVTFDYETSFNEGYGNVEFVEDMAKIDEDSTTEDFYALTDLMEMSDNLRIKVRALKK